LKLIIGFGNPGEKYQDNRQNIGFKVIDVLGNDTNIEVRVKKKKSIIGRGEIDNQEVVLLKPQTFVSLIGESVLYIASFVRVNVNEIICIFEDHTLPFGEIRIDYIVPSEPVFEHLGVKSIQKALKSGKFTKVRVGIGSVPGGMTMSEFLLKDFSEDEHIRLIYIINKAVEVVKMLVTHDVEDVQNIYNPEGAPKLERRIVRKIRVPNRGIFESRVL